MPLTGQDFEAGQVLLIDKPLDWTSFDVVNFIRSFLRKIFQLKKLKVGHAGTLDPLATGLLIICTGKKTKAIEAYQGMDKTYVGSMFLGATTASYDGETAIQKTFETSSVKTADLYAAASRFVGEIEQVPPPFSAIKVDGKRAFDLARKNEEVKLKSRKVVIKSFDLLNIDLPFVVFQAECSKGTYIRSLVHDFGRSLDNGAYLTELRRTRIGKYSVNDAFTIDQFRQFVLQQIDDKHTQ